MPPVEAKPAAPAPSVTLTRKGTARWRSGHPWIFRDDVAPVDLGNGEIVAVAGANGELLGSAFYGSRSKIAIRRLAGPGVTIDRGLFASRLDEAVAYRALVAGGAEALRLVSSDADGIPGLIVDRYGPHLVVQSLTAGVERLLGLIVELLAERVAPVSILARNDATVRALEGLPLEVRPLLGDPPDRAEINESGLRFLIDVRQGQKTGAFLDQRENREAAARYLRGGVLDAFCYEGGFALHAARVAGSVLAIDSSAPALTRGAENAARNGLANVRFEKANVFDFLHQIDRERRMYDGIVLDPPALAKSRNDLPSALRAYKELNLRAMKCLVPGGVLVTCSCSYNLREDGFVEVLAGAAADARRRAVIMEKRSQARDHPVLLGLPESHYLKCLILKVD